ncbi:MAG: phosphate uptake regulator PhoU [Halobacteria archaeon]|nr:phosphate uptake regulator PhoU [Halobacteria archaeon]
MEVRKVQVTGGSTFTISIPKNWARENDVDEGSELAMFPAEGSMVVEPLGRGSKKEGSIDITGVEGGRLVRTVITMYVSGFDIIRFTADRITSEQRRTLREASQDLAGLEVIEETGEEVVFQDLLDSSEISVHRTVSRMRLIAENMFEDSVNAVVQDDDALSRDVVERDEDADRMFAMVSRMFRTSLRDARSEEELGITREECFDYHTAARQLERIADHATKIAEVAVELDEEVPEDIAEAIEEASEDAVGIVDDAMESLLEREDDEAIELANDVLDSVDGIDDSAKQIDQKLYDLDPQTANLLGLVVDSIGRTADYGANIAETALQSAAPKP